ncbi:MAG: GNAT family N-acetyltransferase [Gammaproteobacteria bacterium]
MIVWKTVQDVVADQRYSAEWRARQLSTSNLYSMYHSLEWLECNVLTKGKTTIVAVHNDERNSKLSFAAMLRYAVPLHFQSTRRRDYAMAIPALELLGSELVGGHDYDSFSAIVEATWKAHPDVDAIYLKSVSSESEFWRSLAEHRWMLGSAHIYKPYNTRPFHYVELPPTHEEYMAGFGSKQRFTLKKKVRKLSEAFPGKVEMRRISTTEGIEFLTDSVRQVIEKSWKAQELARAIPESIEKQDVLRCVAERGLLRSHVLIVDDKPCAFIVGYLYNGIYHYADLAYNADYADHSPGTVLLFLVIEDLIKEDHVRFINFGITDAQYKRVFGNRHVEDAALLILRPCLKNSLRLGLHRAFRDSKSFVKRLLKRNE